MGVLIAWQKKHKLLSVTLVCNLPFILMWTNLGLNTLLDEWMDWILEVNMWNSNFIWGLVKKNYKRWAFSNQNLIPWRYVCLLILTLRWMIFYDRDFLIFVKTLVESNTAKFIHKEVSSRHESIFYNFLLTSRNWETVSLLFVHWSHDLWFWNTRTVL